MSDENRDAPPPDAPPPDETKALVAQAMEQLWAAGGALNDGANLLLAAIRRLTTQRDQAEDEHREMLASLLQIAAALNVPPSKNAVLDKIVELYQTIDSLQPTSTPA